MRQVILSALVLLPMSAAATEPVLTAPAKDPNKLICETQEILGTRLGGRRVCMTREQWDEARQRDRQEIERGQRTQTNPTG